MTRQYSGLGQIRTGVCKILFLLSETPKRPITICCYCLNGGAGGANRTRDIASQMPYVTSTLHPLKIVLHQ